MLCFFYMYLILSSSLCLHHKSGAFILALIKILYAFISRMCTTFPIHIILTDLITLIFGRQHKLWRSSLHYFLHHSVTSSRRSKYSPQYPIHLPLGCINFNKFKIYICITFFHAETMQYYLISPTLTSTMSTTSLDLQYILINSCITFVEYNTSCNNSTESLNNELFKLLTMLCFCTGSWIGSFEVPLSTEIIEQKPYNTTAATAISVFCTLWQLNYWPVAARGTTLQQHSQS
jgi:hypothetical protein